MKRLFLENLPLKAAAVVLAVILWLFVIARGQTEMAFNVPIEFTNIPPGIEIAKYAAKSVNVVIRTHESVSKNIRQENVKVNVDVSKAKKGEGTFAIKKDEVKLPYVATVLRIEPPAVKVLFEETVSRKVAVRPVITGIPEYDYYVKSVEVNPGEVVIEGPRSEVGKIGSLSTEPIDISGVTGDIKQEVGFDTPDNRVRTKIDKVDVHVKMGRRAR